MTTRIVTVKLRTEVASAIASNTKAEKSYKRLRDEVERLDNAASMLTKGGLITAFAGVPGSIAPAGAALAALPGLVLTSASAFGVLAIATDGVGAAMKAVGEGDAEKLQKEMAKLSSQAREFVREYERVKPVLDKTSLVLQDEMFLRMRGDLEMLTEHYLPTMQTQLPRLAGQLGRAGHELARWAGSDITVARVNRQIDLASELTEHWTRFLRSGLNIMLDLADASTDFNRDFTKGLADGTEKFERWLMKARAQGDLNKMFENGGRILDSLGEIAAKTGELLFEIMANPALTDATVALLDLLGLTLDVVRALLQAFGALPAPMQSGLAMFLAIAGAAMLLAGRVAALKAALLGATMKLDAMGPAGERAARGLEKASKWAARAGAAFVGLQIIGAIGQSMRDTSVSVDALSFSLERFGRTGEADTAIMRQFGNDLELLQHDLKRAAKAGLADLRGGANIEGLFGDIPSLFTNESESLTLERITALDSALANLARSGNTGAAADAFARLRREASALGIDEAKLLSILPQYKIAAEQAGTASRELAASKQKASMNAAILNAGLAGAVKEAGSLRAAFDQLHGMMIGFASAEIEAEAAIDRLSESFKENGKTLDVTTAAGRENKTALLGVIGSAIDAAQAKYDETQSLEQANTTYQNYINQLRASMLAAGMNKAEVEKLLSVYASMPPLIATSVTTPGLDTAIAKTLRLLQLRQQLGSNVAASNAYNNSGYTSGRRWGGITEYARDGLLRQAQKFSSVTTGARYAFAEPATQGEAFIPKNGNRQRSLGIIDTAARWYGHTIMPSYGRPSMATTSAGSAVSAADMGRAVKSALQGVAVVLDGRVVGRIQAGQADLYARGG